MFLKEVLFFAIFATELFDCGLSSNSFLDCLARSYVE